MKVVDADRVLNHRVFEERGAVCGGVTFPEFSLVSKVKNRPVDVYDAMVGKRRFCGLKAALQGARHSCRRDVVSHENVGV